MTLDLTKAASGADPLIRPGDAVLFSRLHPGAIGIIIELTQRRLLHDFARDLPTDIREGYPEDLEPFARLIHVGSAADGRGDPCVIEMLPKGCAATPWTAVAEPGDRVYVMRPHDMQAVIQGLEPTTITIEQGRSIAAQAWIDADRHLPYPRRELLSYYLWSWGIRKLWRETHFDAVFTEPESDVCSGRYWYWCRQAGLFQDILCWYPDARPEAWYPARIACSFPRFSLVLAGVVVSPGVVDVLVSHPAVEAAPCSSQGRTTSSLLSPYLHEATLPHPSFPDRSRCGNRRFPTTACRAFRPRTGPVFLTEGVVQCSA